MWRKISSLILRNRILIICFLIMITAFFGFHARKVQIQYEFNKLLPENDPTYIAYENFKSNVVLAVIVLSSAMSSNLM